MITDYVLTIISGISVMGIVCMLTLYEPRKKPHQHTKREKRFELKMIEKYIEEECKYDPKFARFMESPKNKEMFILSYEYSEYEEELKDWIIVDE